MMVSLDATKRGFRLGQGCRQVVVEQCAAGGIKLSHRVSGFEPPAIVACTWTERDPVRRAGQDNSEAAAKQASGDD